jgi:FtsH-binding integral membrane protein
MLILEWIKNNWFKVLAAVILFVGIGKHPYGYYEFLRWVASASAFYAAYRSHHAKHAPWTLIFSVIGVLFNPIVPFYLAQSTWQYLDLFAGMVFVLATILRTNSENSQGSTRNIKP